MNTGRALAQANEDQRTVTIAQRPRVGAGTRKMAAESHENKKNGGRDEIVRTPRKAFFVRRGICVVLEESGDWGRDQ